MSRKRTVISTWKHGSTANQSAWNVLVKNGTSLDAIEEGSRIVESDPDVINVGYGGLPDETGRVTLDAAIMGPNGQAGAVAFLEHIKHPISVARLVMEKSEHIMLVGEGALEFALANGFKKETLLTKKSRERWLKWRENSDAETDHLGIAEESHDTLSMIAMDSKGDIAASCTTSGVGWKRRGRVGDSPIIGAGLFVNNEVGAAVGTGRGEIIMQMVGSHFVVERMADGLSPQDACEAAMEKILVMRERGEIRNPTGPTFQAAFLAMNKEGEVGAASIKKGFSYAVCIEGENTLLESIYFFE